MPAHAGATSSVIPAQAGIQNPQILFHFLPREIYMSSFKGYSLLETLIVILFISITILFAIPSFHSFFNYKANQNKGFEFLHIMQLARNSALAQNAKVTLCGSSNLYECSDEWEKGYMLKKDDEILYRAHFDGSGKIFKRIFPKNTQTLEFFPEIGSNIENATFWYCEQHSNYPSWAVVLNQAGRARIVFPNQSNKIIDSQGKPLNCI